MTVIATGWAVVRPDGSVVADCEAGTTEEMIWTIALGWPDAAEIAAAKSRGARAFRCEVREIGEETT